ncbi:MAG: acyl-CoA reductase [Vulcanimicrobiaceae bacterium]
MSALGRVPVIRIVNAIADAASRWSEAEYPPRVRTQAKIVERTGYSLAVVAYALDQLFSCLRARDIVATIERELGSLTALDTWVAQSGGSSVRALPIGRVCIISSRTTIGVALIPAIFALCAKCDILVKDREDAFIRAFFATLAQELQEFGLAARAQQWSGDDDAVDLQAFDAIVAFGNDASLARIARHVTPNARFIAYGSKASIGYVASKALSSNRSANEIAAGAARDFVLYDTEGCLSLHLLFLERGGTVSPAAFARIFNAQIERAAVEFPLGARQAGASARVAGARDLAAFRAASGSGSVFSDPEASFVLLFDPPAHESAPMLPRTIAVRAVDEPNDALTYLRKHAIPIEAVAVAGNTPEIEQMVAAAGASRMTRFGELQRPPIDTYHGGRPRIAEFVHRLADETTGGGSHDGR